MILLTLLILGCSCIKYGYFPMQQNNSALLPSLRFRSSFNDNGTKAITMWQTGIHVWEKSTDQPGYFIRQVITFPAPFLFVSSKLDPSSERLVASANSSLRVYKFNPISKMYEINQVLLNTEVGFAGFYSQIAFSINGNRIMAACNDTNIYVWLLDTNTNQYIYGYRLQGHTRGVYSMTRRGQTEQMITGSLDSNIIVWKWDGSNYTVQQTIAVGGIPTALDLSNDGLTLVSGQEQRLAFVWKRTSLTSNFSMSQTLIGHSYELYAVKFNNNDGLLATSSPQGTRLWEVNPSSGKYELKQTILRSLFWIDFSVSGDMVAQEASNFQSDKALFFKMDIDCSSVDYTDGKEVVNGVCSCRDLYVWQNNNCVIDCSRISFTSGRIDGKTCGCINQMVWNGNICIDKPPTALIAGIVTGVSVLLMGAFLVTRYYRYKAILAETAEANEAQLHEIQMTNDQLKQDPVCPVSQACSVCLEFQTDVVSSCRHVFHKNCLMEWVGRMESCPNCRNPDFTVVIQCHKCLTFLMPRAFCRASCRHKTTVMCLKSQIHTMCIECRFIREQAQQ